MFASSPLHTARALSVCTVCASEKRGRERERERTQGTAQRVSAFFVFLYVIRQGRAFLALSNVYRARLITDLRLDRSESFQRFLLRLISKPRRSSFRVSVALFNDPRISLLPPPIFRESSLSGEEIQVSPFPNQRDKKCFRA